MNRLFVISILLLILAGLTFLCDAQKQSTSSSGGGKAKGLPKRTQKYLLNKPQCNDETQHKIEIAIAKLNPIGPNGRRYPENMGEARQYCRDAQRTLVRVETYFTDCFEKSVRDYGNVLLYTAKRNARMYCGKGGQSVLRRYINLGPCANKHVRPHDTCTLTFMNKTAQLIGLADDSHKIHYACCNYAEWVKCVDQFLESVPCIEPHHNTLMQMFRQATSSVTDIMCGNYNDESDECERLGPQPKPTKKVTKVYEDPVSLAIDLLESFKNFADQAQHNL